jgi:hypothetical protein
MTAVPGMQDLLPVIDAFDAAAGQVKVETEGEKKIAESYQVPCDPEHICNISVVTPTRACQWYTSDWHQGRPLPGA